MPPKICIDDTVISAILRIIANHPSCPFCDGFGSKEPSVGDPTYICPHCQGTGSGANDNDVQLINDAIL